MRKFKKIGIIFDSGGFTGVYGVGFAKAVVERGLFPMYVQGTSVGALSGAVFVEQDGEVDKMIDLWVNVVESHKKGPSFIFDFGGIKGTTKLWKPNILSNAGIRFLLRNIDYQAIVNSHIQFDIVTLDESAYLQKIFSTQDKIIQKNPSILKKVILASTAIPGTFPPIRIGKKYYSDEGAFSVKAALEAGCKTIFVFLNRRLKSEQPWKEIWLSRYYWADQYKADRIKQQEINYGKDILKERLIVFEADKPVSTLLPYRFRKPSKSGSRKGSISQTIEMAYQEGIRVLDSL